MRPPCGARLARLHVGAEASFHACCLAGATAEPVPKDEDAPPVPDPKHPTLMWINEFTKFGVSAAAFGALVYFHNAGASYALSGEPLQAPAGRCIGRRASEFASRICADDTIVAGRCS